MRFVVGSLAVLAIVVALAVVFAGGEVGVFLLIDMPTFLGMIAVCVAVMLLYTKDFKLLGVPMKLMHGGSVAPADAQRAAELYGFLDKLVINVGCLFAILGLIVAVAQFNTTETLIISMGINALSLFYAFLIKIAIIRPSLYILGQNVKIAQ
ncbi:MAG: hypothetical protein FWG65_02035 [Turicibacter sp.]|nr:hypothetical protein [Turicibacter sp.]